jgi:S-adenosylmethionine:tRNA-ribosyltransferase-isomerase (queuine synthetase)
LVSAFVSVPNTSQEFTSFSESIVGKAYQEAIEKEYRFYSFGDASLMV